MKKELSPAVAVALVIIAVIIVGGLLWRSWAGPSAPHVADEFHPHPGAARERAAAFRAAHQRGPGGVGNAQANDE